ncbi:MAG: zinc ABC transporter substrate-binding protein [Sulfitobacter sp.]
MSRKLLSVMAALMGSSVMADVPNVAVDIAPVHSLVAQVMEGVGAPNLIVQPGASPHEYSLRPSEAGALQDADLVFWMGEDLTPWLEGAIETLAEGATVTTFLETEDTALLNFREGALFEAHDHDDHASEGGHEDHAETEHKDHDDHDDHAEDGHEDHDDHGEDGHKDHDAHAETEHDKHDDHDDEHAGHEGHGSHDPHAWLSVGNATTWLNLIAAKLSAADPENASVYFANAAESREEMAALSVEIAATLEPLRGKNFIAFHDAYQYFEADFDFPASGAISLGDASDPSPARIAAIQSRIKQEGIDCVLSEPQFNPGIVDTVLRGTPANTGIVDPLGASLQSGPGLYSELLRNMAANLVECLK